MPDQNFVNTPVVPEVVNIWRISKLSLLNRFTNTELAIYYTAINSNIGLFILDKKMFAAQYIDLKRPDTILGINILASAGIITQDRANTILNTIPNEEEIYRG